MDEALGERDFHHNFRRKKWRNNVGYMAKYRKGIKDENTWWCSRLYQKMPQYFKKKIVTPL